MTGGGVNDAPARHPDPERSEGEGSPPVTLSRKRRVSAHNGMPPLPCREGIFRTPSAPLGIPQQNVLYIVGCMLTGAYVQI